MAVSGGLAQLDAELLDALQSALVVTDIEGNILLWNDAAERLYGYSRQHMQGGNVMQLFVRREEHDEASQIMSQVLAGTSWTGEFPVRCADGRTKRVRITDSPLIRDGEVVGVVGLSEELTAYEDRQPPVASTDGLADLAAALKELEGLRTAMRSRGTIEQAKGVLMATLGVDAERAFEILVRMSQRSGTKLAAVAEDLVTKSSKGVFKPPR